MKKPAQSHPIDAVVQRRLLALERLIDQEYEQSPAIFEARTGIKMAQVNQWFSGYRALRDKALRRLERQTKKPLGWFDAIDDDREGTPSFSRKQQAAEANSLTEHLVTLELAIAALAPVLQQPGRDALLKWAQCQASARDTAGLIDDYAQASKSLPRAPAAAVETPVHPPGPAASPAVERMAPDENSGLKLPGFLKK